MKLSNKSFAAICGAMLCVLAGSCAVFHRAKQKANFLAKLEQAYRTESSDDINWVKKECPNHIPVLIGLATANDGRIAGMLQDAQYKIGLDTNPSMIKNALAVFAFGTIKSNGTSAIPKFHEMLVSDNNAIVAAKCLGGIGGEGVELLLRETTNNRAKVRGAAALGIAEVKLGNPPVKDVRLYAAVRRLLDDENKDVRDTAIFAMAEVAEGREEALDKIIELIAANDTDTCEAAIYTISKFEYTNKVVQAFSKLTNHPHPDIRALAARDLQRYMGKHSTKDSQK